MGLKNTLLAVTDMERSLASYGEPQTEEQTAERMDVPVDCVRENAR